MGAVVAAHEGGRSVRRSIRFDTLNKVLLGLAIIMLAFIRSIPGGIFIGIIITLFLLRAFSSDDYARSRENAAFTGIFSRMKSRFSSRTGKRVRPVRPVHSGYDAGPGTTDGSGARPKKPQADKDHKIFKCPSCKTYLRVPRGKGKILITCSNCGHKLNKKT